MQEIGTEVLREVRLMRSELQTLAGRLDAWENVVRTLDKKKKNHVRREQYELAKKRREEGLLPLPEKCILGYRDKRLLPRTKQWADAGMRFAAADQPENFLVWLVHQWNCCTYLKKPVTFSGSSFRIWNGHTRYAYGSRDLMHYTERKNMIQLFRNPGEHDDFMKRPWWDWVHAVFYKVYSAMEDLGLDKAPERFVRYMKLTCGGFSGYEVYTDMYWDFNESLENMNKMFKRVGTDFQIILRSMHKGLRVRGRESPVMVPN